MRKVKRTATVCVCGAVRCGAVRVCVRVCVSERERERECVCVCVCVCGACVYVCARACVHTYHLTELDQLHSMRPEIALWPEAHRDPRVAEAHGVRTGCCRAAHVNIWTSNSSIDWLSMTSLIALTPTSITYQCKPSATLRSHHALLWPHVATRNHASSRRQLTARKKPSAVLFSSSSRSARCSSL